MKPGQQVTVSADRNETLTRVLVAVENGVYFVCKPEELEAAKREQREPVCVGFKKEYMVGLDREEK